MLNVVKIRIILRPTNFIPKNVIKLEWPGTFNNLAGKQKVKNFCNGFVVSVNLRHNSFIHEKIIQHSGVGKCTRFCFIGFKSRLRFIDGG